MINLGKIQHKRGAIEFEGFDFEGNPDNRKLILQEMSCADQFAEFASAYEDYRSTTIQEIKEARLADGEFDHTKSALIQEKNHKKLIHWLLSKHNDVSLDWVRANIGPDGCEAIINAQNTLNSHEKRLGNGLGFSMVTAEKMDRKDELAEMRAFLKNR